MSTEGQDHPVAYNVQVSEAAEAQLAEVWDTLFMRDPNLALEWQEQMNAALEGLSEFPRRYQRASEPEESTAEIRSFVNRYKAIVYRVTYAIIETDESNPLVRILRVRYAARGE
jgi:plasmid stabilization system protein ParE